MGAVVIGDYPGRDYPGNKISKEARHHAEVARVPILRGELIRVTFSSASTAVVVHGLGRAYRGAIQVSSTDPAAHVGAVDVDVASRAGVDIKTYVSLATASSWTGTVTMWVF